MTTELNQSTSAAISQAEPIPIFKKKSKKNPNTNLRKRVTDTNLETEIEKATKSSDLSTTSQNQIVVKSSKKTHQHNRNPLLQATSGSTSYKKRKMNEDEISSSSSSSGDDDDEETKIIKRGGVSYKAEGSARQQATLENISKQIKKSTNESNDDQNLEFKPEIDDGIYRGNLNLRHQLPKGSAKYGPIKGGPDNIKTITLVDYQPDVCKDYKDTGFCGFGDTCKFLHDRSDYMHGWQLDDAFNSTKNKMKEEEEEEEIPFACLICRKPFEDPIVTKCQHYFCSNCAIKRFNKNPKCFACGSSTNGIFNKASKIIERMKAKQERIRKEKKEKELEENGLNGIEGLEDEKGEEEDGSEKSFYEDE